MSLRSLAQFPDHDEKDYPTNQHHASAHPLLTDAHRHVGAKVTADDGSTRHQQRILPDHITHDRKDQHRYGVDANAEKVLDAVGAMKFVETEDAHRCEHEDAVAGAEVTAVHRREELKDHGAR